MDTTTESAPATKQADPTAMDLSQIASLSIGENLVPELKGEVQKCKVVLDNDIWYMVFKELTKNNHLPPYPPTNVRPQSKEFDNWLRACRLVSRDFDVITKKLGFGFVDLSGLPPQRPPTKHIWATVRKLLVEEPLLDTTPKHFETLRTLFNNLGNLLFLEIGSDDLEPMFLIEVLDGVLGTVRVLELTGMYEEQPVSLTFLTEILLQSSHLESLCLEFNGLDANALKILTVLAQTSALKSIELRMCRKNLGVVSPDYKGTDPDYDTAEYLMKYIHSQRLGTSLSVRLLVRESPPPPGWESLDGSAWYPCRSYSSELDEKGVYRQTGDARIVPPQLVQSPENTRCCGERRHRSK
ncbi:hypothetical protein IFR05_006564 [Cadophora sp. M221]|nr:hypothetical protein IFR05_006564 [Cadophora sp. M221]